MSAEIYPKTRKSGIDIPKLGYVEGLHCRNQNSGLNQYFTGSYLYDVVHWVSYTWHCIVAHHLRYVSCQVG